jgi:flagellar biosynthesis protein FliR
MIVQAAPIMENLLTLIDQYMLEILIGAAIAFVLLFLFRSFRRSMLIGQGQARFVLENYDVRTDKIHKWLTLFIVFLLLPLLAYVKYLHSVS